MTIERWRLAWMYLALSLVALLVFTLEVRAASPSTPKVTLDVSHATPRDVEDQTEQAITRDYAKAWQSMIEAMEQNRPDLLDTSFVGYARDRVTATIRAQKGAGLTRRIVDHGHKLQALFYSIEGSAMQLHDTAQLEVQYLDGGTVVHTENLTTQYIVLMTPAENSWKVRILQELAPESPQHAAQSRVPESVSGSK